QEIRAGEFCNTDVVPGLGDMHIPEASGIDQAGDPEWSQWVRRRTRVEQAGSGWRRGALEDRGQACGPVRPDVKAIGVDKGRMGIVPGMSGARLILDEVEHLPQGPEGLRERVPAVSIVGSRQRREECLSSIEPRMFTTAVWQATLVSILSPDHRGFE